MNIVAQAFSLLVTVEHFYFLWLEMFAWETAGRKAFKTFPKELFTPTQALAANQGLYNGFLAAGLVWSFLIADPEWSLNIRVFFLACVVVAGIFGGLTASKRIFLIQALPALLAIIFSVVSSF